MTDYIGGGAATAMAMVARGDRECTGGSEDEEAAESGSPANAGGVATSGNPKKTTTGTAIDVARKPRGRPPGSKNKPKPPIVITRDPENAMRPHVLELSAGCDVVNSVAQFARRHHLALCVLTAKGTVANVSLTGSNSAGRASAATTLTFHGRFDILSLTGTYLPSNPSASSFTISLAGAQGQVVGGTVAGSLIAAGPIVLIAAAFTNPSFHRLPADEGEECGDGRMGNGGGSGGGSVKKENDTEMEACSSLPMYSPLSCQLPHDAFTWVPSSRPSPY